MKKEYDFSGARRGPVVKAPPGKTRITIRIDDDLLEWFRRLAHRQGGGSYQAGINAALREYVGAREEDLEGTLRRVLREELAGAGRAQRSRRTNTEPEGRSTQHRGRKRR